MPGGLVDEAESALREWLRTFVPDRDRRIPSERFLAKQLKLRHYAVNRAMARMVSSGLIQRDGYKLFLSTAEPVAVPQQKKTCHLIVSQRSIHLPSFRKSAVDLGIDLTVHTWESAEEMVAILHGLKPSEVQCVVLDPPFGQQTSLWQPEVLRLMKLGVPVVSINQRAAGVSCVMADGSRGISLLMDHLLELGHREMAFLTVSPWNPSSEEILDQWKWLCVKRGLTSSTGRYWLQNQSKLMPEEARALARRFLTDWGDVTALIAFTDDTCPVQRMVSDFESQNIRIPDRLSLGFVGDNKAVKFCVPPITVAAVDIALLHETAYQLVFRSLRKKEESAGGGTLPETATVRIQERLIVRGSTAPGPFYQQESSPAAAPSQEVPAAVPLVDPEAVLDIRGTWRQPYELTAQAPEERFTSIDLGSLVNRPLIFRRGWLGDLPLKNLEPGRQLIHGIPFEVLGGNKRSDCGAIVFRSALNTTGSEKKLPFSLDIPIRKKASALYIFHGCGYAKFFNQFATYSFFNGKKELGVVPLISLGRPLPNAGREEVAEALRHANIQDWWPDFPHYNFEHARMAPLLESKLSESSHRHVYLYTLEWINPHPDREVSHMRIEVNSTQSTTLGILAISTLSPVA